jgi:hypothetical protein
MRQNKLVWEDVQYIAENMREWDKKEIYAGTWTEDPYAFTETIMRHPEFGWTFGIERPIVCLSAYSPWPGRWRVSMFATDEFHRIALPLARHIKKKVIPALMPFAHRVDCESMEGHEEAHKWLELLGAKREDGKLERYGKNEETFFTYRWFVEDVAPKKG